jgi:hypothetical protein
MTDNYKTIVERLQPNAMNWVSYRNCIIWALGGKGWHDHLTSDSPTALYATVGDMGNITPLMQWQANDKAAMHMIMSSIPNSVFSNIKSSMTVKAAWDALKLLYEGHTSLILVNLGQCLQSTLVLGKFGLCLKLISEIGGLEWSVCFEFLEPLSPMTRDGGSKISKQTDHSKPPISLISFRHKPNFPNTSQHDVARKTMYESISLSSKKCESNSRPWARQCWTPSILQS